MGRLGPALDAGFFIALYPFYKGEQTSCQEQGGSDDPNAKDL